MQSCDEEAAGQTRVGVRCTAHQADALEQATFDAGHASMHMGWSGSFQPRPQACWP
jgi:hypothetical protein